jgi:hypothetical protein
MFVNKYRTPPQKPRLFTPDGILFTPQSPRRDDSSPPIPQVSSPSVLIGNQMEYYALYGYPSPMCQLSDSPCTNGDRQSVGHKLVREIIHIFKRFTLSIPQPADHSCCTHCHEADNKENIPPKLRRNQCSDSATGRPLVNELMWKRMQKEFRRRIVFEKKLMKLTLRSWKKVRAVERNQRRRSPRKL